MEYKRLTVAGQSLCTFCEGIAFCRNDCDNEARLIRLAKLEDMIVNKQLVSAFDLIREVDGLLDLLAVGDITELELYDKFAEIKKKYNYEDDSWWPM